MEVNKTPSIHDSSWLCYQLLYGTKEEIIEELMDCYGEELKRLVYTYTKSWTQAEDIIQDVFVNVYLHLESFSGQSSLRTWIYSIAINACRDYKRSWHVKHIHVTSTFFNQGTFYGTPESQFLQKDEQSHMMERIMSLPLKYREMILLYYYKEFSIEEISLLTKLNPSTVKTRLKRAREKLHSRLKGLRGDIQ
ncbi:sigma-70 family RNA polymerase sigma factor [Bacillus alkalicellulosilyticus]|uniref:sigma-70 family RNA polymerase sigma factor n=1 Tax=Alkalihalobacterium alkalicellulosilyticum TaxID=1912214 RepID=UPI000998A8A6|nr:sigma-70 family RNA polymerase sigma factor [Bacillus alkalicellulosilyticus]